MLELIFTLKVGIDYSLFSEQSVNLPILDLLVHSQEVWGSRVWEFCALLVSARTEHFWMFCQHKVQWASVWWQVWHHIGAHSIQEHLAIHFLLAPRGAIQFMFGVGELSGRMLAMVRWVLRDWIFRTLNPIDHHNVSYVWPYWNLSLSRTSWSFFSLCTWRQKIPLLHFFIKSSHLSSIVFCVSSTPCTTMLTTALA